MLLAASFIIVNNGKGMTYLTIVDWVNKVWYNNIMEYYVPINNDSDIYLLRCAVCDHVLYINISMQKCIIK
jgi:hypothetical protein